MKKSLETLRQIKSPRYVLPAFMALITQHERYIPKIEWSSHSWTHNVFRVYEMIFGRRCGIKMEMTTMCYGKETYRYCHSFESVVALFEHEIRGFLKSVKTFRIPLKISIPLFYTPQGFAIPSSPYLFAIALDSVQSSFTTTSASTSHSLTHVCSGSNLYLLVCIEDINKGVTAVTYNSASTSQVATSPVAINTEQIMMWQLVNPSTGSHSMTATGSSTTLVWGGISYTGCSASQPDATGSSPATSLTSSMTTSVTVVNGNSWGLLFSRAPTLGQSAGTNCTLRASDSGTDGRGIGVYDTNGGFPSGSLSMTVTWTGTQTICSIMISIGVLGGSPTPHNSGFLMFM